MTVMLYYRNSLKSSKNKLNSDSGIGKTEIIKYYFKTL